ncbi:MAG: sensor domain-containing diguanylate cyclase [Candidatus Thiodiazotropha sp. (ex Lucinoma borealis)]|nr:sensor domain-containing diguanylate cyclase [Candidatus Thiodiazotropha sp. (ex Lucinoma borealis)]
MPFQVLFRVILLGLIITTDIHADLVSPVTLIDNKKTSINLSDSMQVLLDHDKKLTIESISSAQYQHDFLSVATGNGKIGFTQAAAWVRFSLASRLQARQLLLLELDYPLMDRVVLYQPDGSGGYSQRIGGDELIFQAREVTYRNVVFPILLEPGETQTYYLRFTSKGALHLPLKLWDPLSFAEHASLSQISLGLYFGAFLLLIVTAIGGLYLLKATLFFWYALYLAFYGLLNLTLTGLGYQVLWPESPVWQSRAPSILVSCAVISALIFSSKLLDIEKYSRPFFNLFRFTIVLALVGALLSLLGFVGFANQVSSLSGMVLVPVVMVAAVLAYQGGNSAARYFLIAWGVFLVFVFIAGLYYWGVLPHGLVTTYALQIGSVFEVTILAVALADRVLTLNKEKDHADRQAQHYLTMLNEKLGKMVEERTAELERSNRQLQALAIHDSLTMLLNHNAILDLMGVAVRTANRYRQPLCIAMMDIDHFKQINDEYGHQIGDEVLVKISETLNSSLRASDSAGRYGGEEFLLVLPHTSVESSVELVERMRKNIREIEFEALSGREITVSMGLMVYDGIRPIAPDSLLKSADFALYQAKQKGRDRVEWGKLQENNHLAPVSFQKIAHSKLHS